MSGVAAAQKAPIFILSFNRPEYLAKVLASLRQQAGCDLSQRPIVLFQDGAVNPFSGKRYAEDDKLNESVAVFRRSFPDGVVMQSPQNLGIALNFDRAERYGFETLGAEAAIFLEDDLELGPHYIATLDHLIGRFRDDARVGYVAAYGDHRKTAEQQEANHNRLIVLSHNWGFAVYRRQWLKMRSRVLQYLDIVKGGDYNMRDGAKIQELFASWGFGCPGTSQDAAKTIACCADSVIKINTYVCNGAYIGATGVHMNPRMFAEWGYDRTAIYPDRVAAFEPLDDRLYLAILREQLGGAGKPGTTPGAAAGPAKPAPAPASKPGGSVTASDIVNALYRAILRRPADPGGLVQYSLMFDSLPLPQAIQKSAEDLLKSREFLNRIARVLSAGNQGVPAMPAASEPRNQTPMTTPANIAQGHVFVTGCGHTGTTLMATILGSHSAICTLPQETEVFRGTASAQEVREKLRRMRDELSPAKPIICEKTPRHIHCVPKMRAYFPDAKIVLMVRDGRDVTASLKRRTGSAAHAIARWVEDTTATVAAAALPNVMVVKYEDLVQDPARVIADVCAFIGVAFESDMLRYSEAAPNWFGVTEVKPSDGVGDEAHIVRRNWQVHQPLFDGRGGWRGQLEFDDIVAFNRAGAWLMEQLGYYDPLIGDLDNPFPTIPIEVGPNTDLKPYRSWAAQIVGETATAPVNLDDNYDKLLDEEHHRIYGRPWAVGRGYFEFLIQQGVRPTDRFLDFGCGAGRLGIPMIRYLRPAHYFGIEAHRPSLEAFAEYEVPLHGMAYKAPRLLHDDTAHLAQFGTKFDVIVDLYVTHHLDLKLVQHIYQRFAEFLAPGGRVFLCNPPKLPPDTLAALGFEVGPSQLRPVRALAMSHKKLSKTDDWHILRRR